MELKRVMYTATYKGNTYEIPTWDGTSIDVVWDSEKSWYLTGSEVTITDNHGRSKTFIKGVRG